MKSQRALAGSSWLLGSLVPEAVGCRQLVWAPLADMRTGWGQPLGVSTRAETFKLCRRSTASDLGCRQPAALGSLSLVPRKEIQFIEGELKDRKSGQTQTELCLQDWFLQRRFAMERNMAMKKASMSEKFQGLRNQKRETWNTTTCSWFNSVISVTWCALMNDS